MKKIIETRLKNTVVVYAAVFVAMWLMYVLNLMLPSASLGIEPRTVTLYQLLAISGSWAFHGNLAHITGNSIILLGTLWTLTTLEEKPMRVLGMLILTSGIFTWLLGSPNSYHIGASGLIFAIFGYAISHAFYARKISYFLITVLFVFNYYYNFTHGLMPAEGVSWAAHFGGFIGGVVTGYLFSRKNRVPKIKV